MVRVVLTAPEPYYYACILCDGHIPRMERDEHLMNKHNYQPIHQDIAVILDDMFTPVPLIIQNNTFTNKTITNGIVYNVKPLQSSVGTKLI